MICNFIYHISGLFALSRMKDEALEWLENAMDKGFMNYHFLNKFDSLFENIRSKPRFKNLMMRVKHEWKDFEV